MYATAAVVKLDGAGPAGFYDARGVAAWLRRRLPQLECVWLKRRWGRGRHMGGRICMHTCGEVGVGGGS